ncbi:MAG: hypothetical protein IJF92_04755 [Bacilli bacterium]|nr:hypothetical protein [Bacilli bacterium]
MKNIFIGGVAKSGKSRLATLLCNKNKYNHIPVDYFASSFKHNFKDVGITSDVEINKKSSELLALFLSRFIEIAESSDELFILDSAHILPEDIIGYLDPNKWDIYYLGYPNIIAKEKLEEVRKYANEGWIKNKSDEELLDIFTQLISISKSIRKDCHKNNIKFIDTSREDICSIISIESN